MVGHGEKSPVTSNNTREGRAQNRRVEIDVKAPVKAPADTKVEVKAAPATEQKKEDPKPAPPAPAPDANNQKGPTAAEARFEEVYDKFVAAKEKRAAAVAGRKPRDS